MAKILVLNNWSIYPARSGGQQAVLQMCDGLARHHSCTYAYLSEYAEVESITPITPFLNAIELPGKHHRTWRSRLLAPGFLYTDRITKFSLRAHASRDLIASLRRLIAEHDVIIFSHPWAWPAARTLPELEDKLVIYDSHNIEFHIARRSDLPWLERHATTLAQSEIERGLCQRADLILACTIEDRDAYAKAFQVDPRKIHTGFKGVSCDAHVRLAGDDTVERERSALFVGSAWSPNNLAAQMIAHDLASAQPSVNWLIAGTCAKHVAPQPPDNVQLMGFVDDLAMLMRRSLVAVNPITTGTGINMKMMEYLAAGLPVVTTPFGARGITGPAREALVICDLKEFPQAVEQLLNDPVRWHRLSAQGRDAAIRQFDWTSITGRLSEMINAGLQKNTPPSSSHQPRGSQAQTTERQLENDERARTYPDLHPRLQLRPASSTRSSTTSSPPR